MGEMAVEVRVLGPVEAARDGVPVDLGPPQQRVLLVLLVLRMGEVVPTSSLIDALWPTAPPSTATKIVQTYISRLRRALGEHAIETRGYGYALGRDVTTDVALFKSLVASGRFQQALELWRGPAFVDLPRTRDLDAAAGRLEELRLRALEDRFDADLAAGRHREVIPELQELAAAHPLRERLVGQLMTALYGAGRQAEALDTYRRARQALVGELGLEPGAALKDLERRILEHDPSLAPSRPRPRAQPMRRTVSLVAVAAVALSALALTLAFTRTGGQALELEPNTVVRIDPETNEVVQSIKVGRLPGAVVATDTYVWVVNERDGTLSRVAIANGETRTIGRLPSVGFLALDGRGNVYTSGWDAPFVWQIDPEGVEITKRFRVRSRAIGLAVGGGSLWAVDRLVNAVARIDLRTAKVEESIPVGSDPLVTDFGFGALWVANSDDGTVSVVRAGVEKPETVLVPPRPFGIAAGEGAVWVGSNTASTISRIDPDTRRVVAEIAVARDADIGSGLFSVAAGAGGVWGANWQEGTVVRVSPRTNKVVARIVMPGGPRDIAVSGDDVWVSVGVPGDEFP